jgi:hypothetical protein
MKRERIYTTEKVQSDVEQPKHIYLGNLKQVSRKRFVGNVLLEPFLNIPDSFISKSSKTGKEVIRITIDENKNGVDTFGFTHFMRIDDYTENVDIEELDKVPDKKINELEYRILGISESKIAEQPDREVLKTWHVAISKEIAKIDKQISEQKLEKNLYFKLKIMKKNLGILSQQIQERLSKIRRENHLINENFFKMAVKDTVSEEVYLKIIEKYKQYE